MPTEAEQYLIKETTKAIGKIMETLEAMLEDFRTVNMEVVAVKHPDNIALYHESLTKLAQNLTLSRVVAVVLSVSSKEE